MKKTEKRKRVLSIAIVLAICILGTLTSCSKVDETFEPDTTEVIDLNDVGFYNMDAFLDDYDNYVLLRIEGYGNDENGDFVYGKDADSGLRFTNGYIETMSFDSDDNGVTNFDTGRGPYRYDTIDNDSISFNGSGHVRIKERIFISDGIILKVDRRFSSSGEAMYIPGSFVKWETRDNNYDYYGEKCIKYYVK